MCRQTVMNVVRLLRAPPEPAAVHLVERPPEHHHPGLLQFLQASGQQVQFLHPAPVRFRVRLEQVLHVHALVAQPAALRVGRVVEVRADRDQAALLPIIDAGLVGHLEGEAAPAEVRVVHADHGRPVPGLVVDPFHQPQLRPVAEIGELAGHDPFVRPGRPGRGSSSGRPGLWGWHSDWPVRRPRPTAGSAGTAPGSRASL